MTAPNQQAPAGVGEGGRMRRGPKSRINAALRRVAGEVSVLAAGRGDGDGRSALYARGLSSEGWSGGYAAALRDVLLVLNGVQPNTRDYWHDWDGPGRSAP